MIDLGCETRFNTADSLFSRCSGVDVRRTPASTFTSRVAVRLTVLAIVRATDSSGQVVSTESDYHAMLAADVHVDAGGSVPLEEVSVGGSFEASTSFKLTVDGMRSSESIQVRSRSPPTSSVRSRTLFCRAQVNIIGKVKQAKLV